MSFMTAEVARTKGDWSKFGSTPFFTPGRVSTLLDMLGPLDGQGLTTAAPDRVAFEWNQRVMRPDDYVVRGKITPVWYVPGTYDEPGESVPVMEQIDADFGAAADFAIRWRVVGDEVAAAKCVEILTAWSTQAMPTTIANATTPLAWCSRWPTMIMAAMLVADYTGYTTELDTALKALTTAGLFLSLAYTANNNTGAWGVCLELASASFVQDRSKFDRAIRRWYNLFDQCVIDNIPFEEVHRPGNGTTGLWYSNFLVYAMTAGAEWARFNGEWLYDHAGPDGSTFRGLVDQVRFWTRYPASFVYNTSGVPSTTFRSLPHDEILHALWPTAESLWIINAFPTGNDRESSGLRNAALIYRDRPLYG